MAGTYYTNTEFELRGFNHLALVCRDMQETVEFYTEILQVVNVGWNADEDILLFSEVAGIWPHGSFTAKPQYIYQGGMQYYPNDDLTLYFQAGAGLNEAADNFFVGGGFAVRTP